ncbi:MAG: hypothetical protein AAGG48_15245 [Planctomycetota bacterium]
MTTREYPFNPADHQVFEQLARRMRIFAYVLIVSAGLSTVLNLFQVISMLGVSTRAFALSFGSVFISDILCLVIALLALSASAALAQVTRNDGNDVAPFMTAVQALKRLFAVQYWMLLVLILFIVLMMLGIFTFIFMLN